MGHACLSLRGPLRMAPRPTLCISYQEGEQLLRLLVSDLPSSLLWTHLLSTRRSVEGRKSSSLQTCRLQDLRPARLEFAVRCRKCPSSRKMRIHWHSPRGEVQFHEALFVSLKGHTDEAIVRKGLLCLSSQIPIRSQTDTRLELQRPVLARAPA